MSINMTQQYFQCAIFGAVILAAGVFQGLYTDRWGPADDVQAATRRLDSLPIEIGDWRGEPAPLDDDDVRYGGIKGYKSLRYRNVISGDNVSLLIVCGRSGPISVHTPDVCYRGAGFVQVGNEFRKELATPDGRTIVLAAMQFKAPTTSASNQIEVNWVWHGNDGWLAPENPRLELARNRTLYKLYVIRDMPAKSQANAKDASLIFFQALVPVLDQLFAN